MRRLIHWLLGWGFPDESRRNDGCSDHAMCVICGEDLMLDSQGNWFHHAQLPR